VITPIIKGESDSMRTSLFTAYRNTVRAVRTKQWKLIRYPERDYMQLFNLENDPLEINNLAMLPESKSTVDSMTVLLKQWQVATDDTAALTAKSILPLEYNPERFEQNPDVHQPKYTLDRYFTD